ncbi:MAG TPA: hypothetical protein VFV41_13890 [Streptosporangiaceae bacterium]|nr:hypothetical protein [Streptosporangiaceae bacterium]
MTLTQEKKSGTADRAVNWLLYVVDAGLMVTSGAIHVHLWDIAYRHVATLGPLFLVQAIAALILAVAVLVTRNVLVVAAALALMAGTIVGFICVRTVGLFGFTLTFTSGLAYTVLIVEIVAVAALALTGSLLLRRRVQAA